MKIFVVKLRTSNWPSVISALNKMDLDSLAVNVVELTKVSDQSIIILPGVGNIQSISEEVEVDLGIDYLKDLFINRQHKIIGICLGFQFMCSSSDEHTKSKCLGLFDEKVSSLYDNNRPSVGWKEIKCYLSTDVNYNSIKNSLGKQFDKKFYYFTHCYGVKEKHISKDALPYIYELENGENVVAALMKGNFIGLQFHPEKSGEDGLELINGMISRIQNKALFDDD